MCGNYVRLSKSSETNFSARSHSSVTHMSLNTTNIGCTGVTLKPEVNVCVCSHIVILYDVQVLMVCALENEAL